jgi:hypothetical protein
VATGVELATAYVSLSVSTRGIGRDIAREFGGVERSAETYGKRSGDRFVGGLKGKFAKIGGLLAGAFAVSAGVDFFKDAVGGASDLNEAATKTQAIFGDAGKAAVDAFANKGAKALGQTRLQVLDAAASFGTFGKAAGLTGKPLAKFSTGFASLATDMASFFNTDPADATEAIAAGLRGEAEPLRKYGVLLDDASMRQEALKLGLIKTTKQALTPQQKVLAAQALIYKQTKDAQGDFGRTSGGLANQQRILSATFTDFKTNLGKKLLPVVTNVVSFFNNKFGPVMGDVAEKVGGFFSKAWDGATALFDLFIKGDFTSKFREVFGLEEDSPLVDLLFQVRDFFVTELPPAIATGKRVFKVIADYIKAEVVPRVMGIVDAIRGFVVVAIPIVKQFVAGMLERIQPLMPTIQAIFGTIGEIISGALDLIKAIIERVTSIISWVWSNWGQGIMDTIAFIWEKVLAIIQPALEAIKGLIRTFTAIFKGDWSTAWESLKGAFSSAWKTVRAVIDGALSLLGRALSIAWDGIVSVAGTAWEKLTGAISGPLDRVMQFIQENFIDKINGLFEFLHIPVHITPIWKESNVGSGMRNAGRVGTYHKLGDARFAEGGYTGPGSKWQPAGIVHAGEWVINQQSVKGISRDMPGLLPFLNGYASGGFVKPVNAAPGFPYGRYPSGKIHRALDFPVPVGTPVRSAYSGTVLYAGWDSTGYGNVVRTSDSDGAFSIYGHNSRLLVKSGQAINAGQLISLSGSTGNSTGPHLHWARRTSPYNDATAFNPFGSSSGAGFNPIASLLKSGIEGIASGASGFAGRVGGPFGPVFANILGRLIKGAGSRALSLLGIEGGELRPRLYDQGGMIPPGDTLVRNKTGAPETLLPFDIREMAAGLDPERVYAAVRDGAREGTSAGFGYQAREVAIGGRR